MYTSYMTIEAMSDRREGEESAETAFITKLSWEQSRELDAAWKKDPPEKTAYDRDKDLIQLLLARKHPEKAQSIAQRLRGEAKGFAASIDGKERKVAIVDAIVLGHAGTGIFEGITHSTLDDHIVIAKDFGPCPFLAGFREGKGFIAHILPQNANRFSIDRLLTHVGIAKGDEKVSLFVGAGQTGKPMFGSGQSGGIRRATLEGAELHGIPASDIDARRDTQMTNEQSAVILDPVRRKLIVFVDNNETIANG